MAVTPTVAKNPTAIFRNECRLFMVNALTLKPFQKHNLRRFLGNGEYLRTRSSVLQETIEKSQRFDSQ